MTRPRIANHVPRLLFACALLSMVLVALSMLRVPCVIAATQITLCTNYPIGHPLNKGLHELQKLVAKYSDDRYEIRLLDNGKYGNTASEIQALQAGAIQFVVGSTGNYEPFFPALSVFDLPYMITDYESGLAAKLLGPVVTDFLQAASTKRVEILSVMGCGVRYIFTKKPVHTLEDVRGLKMRTTPSRLHMDIVSALGMTPTPMAWSELYTALQQGVVEGCDPELPSGVAMGFRAVTPYWAKFDTAGNVAVIFTNAQWWRKLPQEARDMFMKAIHETARNVLTAQQEADRKIIEEEKAQGREVYVPTPEEKARWIAATADIYKKLPQLSEDMVAKMRAALSQ